MSLKKYFYITLGILLLLFIIDSINTVVENTVGPNLHNVANVVVANHTVTVTDIKGKTSTTYIPPEGKVIITKKPIIVKSTSSTESITSEIVSVKIVDWGMTKRVGLGLVYSNGFLPQVDLKFFYWKRYSSTVGINTQYANIGIYRHVDDLIGLDNLEFGANYGIGFNQITRIGIGVRINL